MNALLSEIRRSLVELDKGLKGQLNMSQSMEDLATAFGLNEWPGRNPFAQVKRTYLRGGSMFGSCQDH